MSDLTLWNSLRSFSDRLRRHERGVAFIEFAYALPIFLTIALGGIELAHFVTTKMRVSQLALHMADHSARIGSGTLLAAKTINESQINDLFTGTGLQSSELDLYKNGRVILSSLEADPARVGRYKIAWQRCKGEQVHASSFGKTGDDDLAGMGPTAQMVKAPKNGATMFVEVYYKYRPLIAGQYVPELTYIETASMTVRDRRDLTKIYESPGAVPSTCT